jgi:predicted RNA-binding protein with RPS1 domain
MSIDENIMNFIYQENKQTTLPYQPGDIIPVRITKLVDYGAFCVTKDDYLASGLIHISQIPDDLNLHTMQVIEAEVIRIKEENKLELSLLHHEKKDNPFQVLSQIKEPLPEKQVPSDEVQQIIQYLSKEFGLVSEESKQKVEEMVKEIGVFRFTMILNKTLPDFKRDLVYHFLKEMSQRRDCL